MIQIGPVVITDVDGPEKIPLGGELDAAVVKLSDGSRTLKITGFTPDDFELAGTMRETDGSGDPYTKIMQLQELATKHQPVTFIASGADRVLTFPVIVWKVKAQWIETDTMEYTITLFHQSHAGLISNGYVEATTLAQRAAAHHAGMSNVQAQTGAATQAAITAAQAAYAALFGSGV